MDGERDQGRRPTPSCYVCGGYGGSQWGSMFGRAIRIPPGGGQASFVNSEARERPGDDSCAGARLCGGRAGRRAGVARQTAFGPLDRRREPLSAVLRRRNYRHLVRGLGPGLLATALGTLTAGYF